MPEITYLEAVELAGTEKQKEYARKNKWFNGGSFQSFIERIACYYTNPRKGKGRINKVIIYDEVIPREEADRLFKELIERKEAHRFDKETGKSNIGGGEKKGLKNDVATLLYKTISSLVNFEEIEIEEGTYEISNDLGSVGMTKTRWMQILNLSNKAMVAASYNVKNAKRMHGLMSLEDGYENVNQDILSHVLHNENKYASERFLSILNTLIVEEKFTKEVIKYATFKNGDFRALTTSEYNQLDEISIKCLSVVNAKFGKQFKMETVMANYSSNHYISLVQREFKNQFNKMIFNLMGIKYLNDLIFITPLVEYKLNIKVDSLRKKIKNEIIRERTKRAETRETKLNKKEQEIYESKKELIDCSDEESSILTIAKMKKDKTYALNYGKVISYIWSEKVEESLTELKDTTEIIKDDKVTSKAEIEKNISVSAVEHKLELLKEAQHESDCNYVFGDLLNEEAVVGNDQVLYDEYVSKAKECGKRIYMRTLKDDNDIIDPFNHTVEYRLERAISEKRTRSLIPALQEELNEHKKASNIDITSENGLSFLLNYFDDKFL